MSEQPAGYVAFNWLTPPFTGRIGGVNPADCLLTDLVCGMASLVRLQRQLQRALAVALKVQQQGDEA